ncbi:MAG: Stp1/IreP family PP2C-type Ser/Thr phosphatase [Actinobacteria bacterium]|nr:Stp1/IreP family PP2C-type Ser/Thr phosphatase [Actinomycetota bacterium]MBU1943844.1 Stp1/IreP family PP2C-type Ser/Thr phosphatase [Actinomycetota bacterium]MBU2687665.1 Stp1/IreP family PP2C-type Ser/Thr phosphatase [Actinomycetota bacterium]
MLESGNLFAVADGMGGHQAGEVASSLALSIIGQYVEDNLGLLDGEKLVEKAVAAANAAVHAKALSRSKYRDMGTTLTALYREGDTAYIANVGDSRAYLFRGGTLRQLTRDQSLVQALVDEGEITPEEARRHPQRNVILKALGLEPQVDSELVSVKIERGDLFLLCSDGLNSMVEDAGIEAVLAAGGAPAGLARALVDAALEAGGADNVSVVLVSFAESATVIPVKGEQQRAEAARAQGEGGTKGPGGRRRVLIWGAVIGSVFLLLAAGFAVAYYFYDQTYFVGSRGGKVTLFHGFPFWDLAAVEEQTDINVSALPLSVQQKVEGKMEPESRSEALKTLESLERMAAQMVIVPDVVGKSYTAAKKQLQDAGLEVAEPPELIASPNARAGTVFQQDPEGFKRVARGTWIKLKVVSGTKTKEV